MDSAALYRLMTWLSPAYPTGAFTYSHGLEAAIEAGLVKDRATLIDWLGYVVAYGSGRAEAMLFRCAYERAGDAAALDQVADLAAALRGSAELALESEQQGEAFLATTRRAWPAAHLDAFARRRHGRPVTLSVAVALAVAETVPIETALLAYLQALVSNLVMAGVRLIPLGQSDGQQAIAALAPAVMDAVGAALDCPLENIGSASPMVDWCSMRHETQYTRLFRS